ncbi:MAG TPA: hypothetical protein PKW33_15580 [Anaerolineaceae bacterium]|nr:hypothetical protein [Anaerolineaceae bacterium]HPN53016.1 hypothetical protein [Anaerolineaceae bacterium]
MNRLLATVLVLAIVMTAVGPVQADSVSGFQYHGYITLDGSPVTGECDFDFALYDASTNGNQVGTTQTHDDITVTSGWFWVTLNFGSVFDGTSLWLETSATCNADPKAPLSPRQELGATPYALNALTSPWSGLTGVPAGFADGIDDVGTYTNGSGLALTGNQFSVDFGVAQVRVTGSCSAGDVMTGVNQDGSVNCAADQGGTTYTAGWGLSLSGTEFSASSTVLQSRVLGQCSGGYHMTGINQTGIPTCTVDVDTNTTYTVGFGLVLNGTEIAASSTVLQARISNTCSDGYYVTGVNASGTATCTAVVTATHNINSTTYHTGGPLTIGNGGTGTSTTQTAGSIWLTGATGAVATSNLYFDSTNGYLGVGTRYPGWEVDVRANKNGSAGYILVNASSAGTAALEYFILGQATSGGKYGGFYHFNDGYSASSAWDEPKSTAFISSDVNGMNFISFGATAAADMIFYVGGGASSNKVMTLATSKAITTEGALVSKGTHQATGYNIGNSSGTLTATGLSTTVTVLYNVQISTSGNHQCSYVTMTYTGGILTAVSSPTAWAYCPIYME